MRDEVAERFTVWASNPAAIMGNSYVVTLDGKPLSGATLTFVPESYLGENVKPATGDTFGNRTSPPISRTRTFAEDCQRPTNLWNDVRHI